MTDSNTVAAMSEAAARGQPHAARRARRRRRRPARLRRRRGADHRQGRAAKRAHLEWVQKGRSAGLRSRSPVPGRRRKMQLTEGGLRATGTNVSGYSLFRVLVDAADRRRRADRRRPDRMLDHARPRQPKSPRAPAACAPPTRAPAKSCLEQEVPETVAGRLQLARHRTARSLEARRPARTLHHREGDQARMARIPKTAPSGWRVVPAAGKPRTKTSYCPSSRSGKRPAARGADRLHAEDQRRQGDRRDRGRAAEASRRRSTKRPKKQNRRTRRRRSRKLRNG